MSRTDARRWLLLGLAAFGLRVGVAVLTEYEPLFPPYYYHDAAFAERIAWDMAASWRAGRSFQTTYASPQRMHAALLAVPYFFVGRHPLPNKLMNAAFGATAVVLFGLASLAFVPVGTAYAAAAIVAVWPSHVFNTAQNFKESPTLALACGALALLLPLLSPGATPRTGRAAGGALLLALAGLFRSYVLFVLAGALAAAALFAMRARATRSAATLALAAVLAAPFIHRGAEKILFGRLISAPTIPSTTLTPMVPALESSATPSSPWTPTGITRRRESSQASDRLFARQTMDHEIGTQILPGARLETWLDVSAFLPRAAFQVLFMPLPGLYPMDGKLGRMLAGAENVALLFLAGAAALGLSRRRPTPPSAAVLVFFAVMTAGSALFEFDLGSASRHKLLYLPMLFPFAVEELSRRLRA